MCDHQFKTVHNGTGECKVLIINHDNITPTSCTFMQSDTAYHATLQEFGYPYTNFYRIHVCKVIEHKNLMNHVSGNYKKYNNSEGQHFSKAHHKNTPVVFPMLFLVYTSCTVFHIQPKVNFLFQDHNAQ